MLHAFIIEPTSYDAFDDEATQMEKCKEWGLLTEKASKNKAFFYKGNGMNLACSIVGSVDKVTAVIQFENEQKHCIHPSYLKEMQAANYGTQRIITIDDTVAPDVEEAETAKSAPVKEVSTPVITATEQAEEQPKTKAKKSKAPKLELPEEKVKMTATVTEFVTVPNHFSDTEDEVVIYEAVAILDPATEIGTAWSSHSATLKKFELEVGDVITFDGKIVAKKLTKHPVPYKINNPAKIQKQQTE